MEKKANDVRSRSGGKSIGVTVTLMLLSAILFFGTVPAMAGAPDGASKVASHTGSKGDEKQKYKAGEILVKFRLGVTEERKKNLHRKHTSEKIKEFKTLRIHHVKLRKNLSVEDAVKLYKADPDVEYAEPNYAVSVQETPNDSEFGELWGLHNTGKDGGKLDADIDAPEAWDLTTGSSDLIVAVVDTGIDYNHPDLAANMWTNPDEIAGNGIDDDSNGYIDDVYGIDTANDDSDPMDDYGHGTHVAGTIGAVGNNSTGVVGVNWNVKVMSCKFIARSGYGYTDDAIECLQYIKPFKDRGMNIVATNNSWGCQGDCYSQALYDAIDDQREILFFASAGNSGADNDVAEFYPTNYYVPNLIAVAATNKYDNKWSSSNYGRRSVHVGAPGENILSTVPGNDYKYYSGTSMAAPHVSGVAALLKSHDINRDWREIKNLILSGGDSVNSMDGVTVTGKRLNAHGSLTCTDSTLFSALKYPESITVRERTTLSALSISCGAPLGPVTVTLSDGKVIDLYDNGRSPDPAAGDGIFTGTWRPSREGERLTFSSPAGTETIIVPPLAITTDSLPDSVVGTYYSQTITAEGGLPPYSWSLISGSLPPGLTLGSSTGEISGTSTTTGIFNFTVQLEDEFQTILTKDLFISINDVTVLWEKTYDGGTAYSIAVDGSGNIYVTGFSSFDYQTIKYDPSGNVLWTATYDSGHNDYAHDIAVDESGNVYVTGYYYYREGGGTTTRYNYLTVKYDTSGNIIWARTHDTSTKKTARHDYAYGVEVDGSGNVIVTGSTEGVLTTGKTLYPDYLTIKYDSSGSVIWTKTYDHNKYIDVASDIAVDGSGNIYVTGTTGIYAVGQDYLTIKYSPSGRVKWIRTYTYANYDRASGIILDGSGNVYVTGYSTMRGWGADDHAYLTVKYDSSGNVIWNSRYNDGSDDYAEGISVDGSGNVYVTGHSWNGFDWDYLTTKSDASGNILWSKTYNGGLNDLAYDIAVDADGNVLVTGSSNYDYLTIKYQKVN